MSFNTILVTATTFFLFWHSTTDLCHTLLNYSYCSQHIEEDDFTRGAWTDWPVVSCNAGVLIFCFAGVGGGATGTWLACGCCCWSPLFRSAAAKETRGVMMLEENTLPVVVLGVLCVILLCISSLAYLQPRYFAEYGLSPSANLQLQHVGVEAELPFSGHSLFRWRPWYHKQRGGGCLQLAQTWPNCLKVMTLYKASLGTIRLYLDGDVAKASQIEDDL
jgi:hypothetical protein